MTTQRWPAVRGARQVFLDPVQDDPGSRLRRLRLRRGLSQEALAGQAGVPRSFISMVETGQRQLGRYQAVAAIADVLRVSPADLIPGPSIQPGKALGTPLPAFFPAAPDGVTLAYHARLAAELAAYIDRGDRRAAGQWLRRLSRNQRVNPWLLLDQLAGRNGCRGRVVR